MPARVNRLRVAQPEVRVQRRPGPDQVAELIDDAVNNDLLISASFAYTSAAFAEVTRLLSSGQIRPAPLITHRFPLEDYAEAYQVLREGSGPRGKVILDISQEDAR